MRTHGAERNEVSFVVRAILAIFAAAGFCLYLAVMAVMALPMLVVVILRAATRLSHPAAVTPTSPPPAPQTVRVDGIVIRQREHADAV